MDCGDANTPATMQCLITTIFPNVIHAAITFSGVVVMFLIATSGLRMIVAHNDPKQLEAAKGMLFWAFLGLVVILLSVLLLHLIATVLNIPCLQYFSFTSCT